MAQIHMAIYHISQVNICNAFPFLQASFSYLGDTLIIEAVPLPTGEVLDVGIVVATWSTAGVDHDGEQLIYVGSPTTSSPPGTIPFIVVCTATAHIYAFIFFLSFPVEILFQVKNSQSKFDIEVIRYKGKVMLSRQIK